MLRYDEKTALIVVDVQNDFADPAGSLAVARGDAIVPLIDSEIEMATGQGALVVLTQDWHPASTPHFKKDGGIWPVHCVADTWGARLHPDLTPPSHAARIRKGANGEDGYSGLHDARSGQRRDRSRPSSRPCFARPPSNTSSSAASRPTTASRRPHSMPHGSASTRLFCRDAIAAVNLEPGDGERALDEMREAGRDDVADGDAMISRLILTPIRLAIVGLGIAWVVDRLLRLLARGAPPEPIRSLVVIDAPIERVWDVVVDIDRQPVWMREMKAVRVLTPGPVGVGTRGEATVRVFGITTIDPVTGHAIRATDTASRSRTRGHSPAAASITLEPGADGTTTILRWEETLDRAGAPARGRGRDGAGPALDLPGRPVSAARPHRR